MIKFDIITIFPELFESFKNESLLKKAREKNLLSIDAHNLRDFAHDKHRTVDDCPYGGGFGMVMKVDVWHMAIANATKLKLVGKKLKPIKKDTATSRALPLPSLDMISLLFSFSDLPPDELGDGEDEGEELGRGPDELGRDQGGGLGDMDSGLFRGRERQSQFLHLMFHHEVELLKLTRELAEISQGLFALGGGAPELGEKTNKINGHNDPGDRQGQKKNLIQGEGHYRNKIKENRGFVNEPAAL